MEKKPRDRHSESATVSPGKSLRILVADDNEDIRQMLADLLRFRGYEVYLAEDGEKAVAIAGEKLPDLILMDVMMPRLSGLEAARQIQELPGLESVPIIAISAFRNPSSENSTGTFRWHAYLSKPFESRELELLISGLQPS